jgi:hypothetical protein
MQPQSDEHTTTAALVALTLFAATCLGFHLFGSEKWVPLLDHANLALHEAGHPLIGVLSLHASVYGGTLFQLAFPIALAWHYRRLDKHAGVAASVVWLGENLLNVARYMADARQQLLPLVGSGDHDWAEIFGRWDVLRHDATIANLTRTLGLLLIVGAVVWLHRRWRVDNHH